MEFQEVLMYWEIFPGAFWVEWKDMGGTPKEFVEVVFAGLLPRLECLFLLAPHCGAFAHSSILSYGVTTGEALLS